MSIRAPREVPAIDFDLDNAFAGHRLLAVMCWPNMTDRQLRLATIWADVADTVEDVYGPFLYDVSRPVQFHGFPPPPEALDWIIEDNARDGAHRDTLIRFVEDVALPPVPDREIDLTLRFWAGVTRAPDKFISPGKFIWENLIRPIGGLRAIADGPSFNEIRDEISNCIRGHPMLAGLSFYLIAAIDAHHSDLTLSYNETYRIFSATFDNLKVSSVDWLKTRLPFWHPVAALWAGLLAEADCWLDGALVDIDKLETTFLHVLKLSERRQRFLSYAAWFSDFVVDYSRPDNIRRRPDRIIRFPDAVQPIKPDLRPLTGPALTAARHYR